MQRLWLFVVLLTFSGFIRTQSQDITIFDECQSILGDDACTSVTLENCSELNVSLSYGNTVDYQTSVDLNSVIGGATNLYCADITTPPCSMCWSIYNVSIHDESLQSCYGYSISCHGHIPINQEYPLGCETVPIPGCTASCPESCGAHGQCVNGACRCDEGYQGETCNIAVGAGCLTLLDDPDVNFCLTPNLASCNRLVYHISGSALGNSHTWPVSIAGPARESQSASYTITGFPTCETYLHLVNFTVYETGLVAGTVVASLSCLNNQTFIVDYSELMLSEICESVCSFSSNDPGLIPEPKNVKLVQGETKYYYMEQLVSEPIADASIIVNLTRGSLEMYENKLCRPTTTHYDSYESAPEPSEHFEWMIFNNCDAALTAFFNTNEYYFMFLCTALDGCQFSLTLIRHTIVTLNMDNPSSNRPILNIPSQQYQYFQLIVPQDDFYIRLQVHHPTDVPVSGTIYIQDGACASQDTYIWSSSSRSSSVTIHNQVVDTYQLDVYPEMLGVNAGEILAITIVFAPIIDDRNVPAGYFSVSAFYIDELGTNSIPDTAGTDPVVVSSHSDTYTVSVTDGTLPESSTSKPNGSTYSISATDSISDTLEDDSDSVEDDDNPDSSSTSWFLYVAIAGAVLLVLILVPIIAFALYKLKRARRTKFPLSIDDDGLLLSNDDEADFEL